MIRELKKLAPSISFYKPGQIVTVEIHSLSNASHTSGYESYGQTGIITGLKITDTRPSLYHPLIWSSHKQKKILYSSFGADILAAADADDRGYHLKSIYASLFPDRFVRHELIVDSKLLFETITTLHQSEDYRLRKIVTRLRDTFESKELNSIKWISGSANYANVLTKHKLPLSLKLNSMLCKVEWHLYTTRSCMFDSELLR